MMTTLTRALDTYELCGAHRRIERSTAKAARSYNVPASKGG